MDIVSFMAGVIAGGLGVLLLMSVIFKAISDSRSNNGW